MKNANDYFENALISMLKGESSSISEKIVTEFVDIDGAHGMIQHFGDNKVRSDGLQITAVI